MRLSVNAVALILCVTVTSVTLRTQALAQEPNEHQVKAAFLFNFVKFVEWPQEVFNDDAAPVVVGILGEDPTCSAISLTINGKIANGRRLVVKRFPSVRALTYCHILFIGGSQKNNLQNILAAVGARVLTVGETDQFLQTGGIVNFIIVDSKVRFEINQTASEKAGLRISAKLLGLAHPSRR
jgi:hypothetical protein